MSKPVRMSVSLDVCRMLSISLHQSVGMALSALQILNSYIQFEVSHGPSDVASMQLSKTRVTDGEWHHVLIELRSAKEGKDIKYLAVMTLDYGMDQVSMYLLYPPENHSFIGPRESTVVPNVPVPAGTLEVWRSTGWHPWLCIFCSTYAEDTSVVWSRALPTWVSQHGASGAVAELPLGRVALSSISSSSPVPLCPNAQISARLSQKGE